MYLLKLDLELLHKKEQEIVWKVNIVNCKRNWYTIKSRNLNNHLPTQFLCIMIDMTWAPYNSQKMAFLEAIITKPSTAIHFVVIVSNRFFKHTKIVVLWSSLTKKNECCLFPKSCIVVTVNQCLQLLTM